MYYIYICIHVLNIYTCIYIYIYTYIYKQKKNIYQRCPWKPQLTRHFKGPKRFHAVSFSLAMDGTICGQSIWRSDPISESSARAKGEPLAQCPGLMFNITVINLNHHPKNSQKVNPVWNQRPMNQCSGFLQVSPPNVPSCSKASGSTAATPQPWSDHRFGAVTRIFIYSAIFAAIHPSIRPSLHPSIHPSTCLSMYTYIYIYIYIYGITSSGAVPR